MTDELILFAFQVEPTTFRTIEESDQITKVDGNKWTAYTKRVVRDAEKAFINLLDPSYNDVKFIDYPTYTDGLYGYGHDRYGYVIAENVTFATAKGVIRGSWDPQRGIPGGSADMIAIAGDTVEIFRGTEG